MRAFVFFSVCPQPSSAQSTRQLNLASTLLCLCSCTHGIVHGCTTPHVVASHTEAKQPSPGSGLVTGLGPPGVKGTGSIRWVNLGVCTGPLPNQLVGFNGRGNRDGGHRTEMEGLRKFNWLKGRGHHTVSHKGLPRSQDPTQTLLRVLAPRCCVLYVPSSPRVRRCTSPCTPRPGMRCEPCLQRTESLRVLQLPLKGGQEVTASSAREWRSWSVMRRVRTAQSDVA